MCYFLTFSQNGKIPTQFRNVSILSVRPQPSSARTSTWPHWRPLTCQFFLLSEDLDPEKELSATRSSLSMDWLTCLLEIFSVMRSSLDRHVELNSPLLWSQEPSFHWSEAKTKLILRKRKFQEVVLDLVKEAMLKAIEKGSKGFLIDGYPREVVQGQQFESEVN